jgi:O-6-methylguanine DNA methyltransferase
MIGIYTKNFGSVWFGVACDEKSVYATTFASDEKEVLNGLLGSIPFNIPFQHVERNSVLAEKVMNLLKDICDGKDVTHSLRFATRHLSDYTKKVLKVTSLIPVGYVSSYGAVAKAAGGSPRAVGRIMAQNPFPPIVPCHRVVSSDFTLGGYGGGLDVKLDFLKRESRGYASKREVTADGGKLQLFPVELVLRRLEKSKR